MRSIVRQVGHALVLAGACVAVGAGVGEAQTSTGSIRGFVTSRSGEPLVGATITARSASTGVVRNTVARDNGFYALSSLTPDVYEVSARRIGSAPQSRQIRVGVGEVLTVSFQLADTAAALGPVVVSAASTAAETRTTEVATNISQQQINDLPTSSRNFLDLAALAPGTRVTPDRIDGTGKTFAAGALPADNINVFIDGASYKNDIITGGVAGQDASRGNPFPRNALQEFRIITNNFKAEYQKASSAIITAVTKSGGNTWQGSAFSELQNKSLVSLDTFQRVAKEAKPAYSRYLVGFNLGGPLIRDKLFFFGAYEGNYQNRDGLTIFGGDVSAYPPQVQALNNTAHTSPFRENLGFMKLTYTPNERQQYELEGDLRHESDTRGFGGQFGDVWRVYQGGEDHRNNVYTTRLKQTYFGPTWTNEALVSYQHYLWNQDPLDFTTPVQVSWGNYWIGGDDAAQALKQDRVALRDDWTYTGWQWAGAHVVKIGASYDFTHYDMNKQLNENPKFVYDASNNYQFPVQAQIGFGNGDITQNNGQFGVYAQDDWSPTQRLTINAGLRWDLETGMFNRDYVTPTAVRDSLTMYRDSLLVDIDPNRYFSNGSNRKLFLGAIQPRIGASYALDGAGRTVAFASFGIFYDRLPFNSTLDETYRRQHPNYTINFKAAGDTTSGKIAWDTSYFSAAGLKTLIASVSPPQEVFLIPNDLKPPKSNQWSVGVRHDFGSWNGSLTYNGTRGYDGFSFEWANVALDPARNDCCITANVPAYQNVLVGNNSVHTWYDALLVQVNRPYRQAADGWGWGAGVAYTLSKAEAEGGDLFSFPQVTAGPNARHPIPDDRRHQVVINWVTDIPFAWGIQFSGLMDLASGVPIHRFEFVALPGNAGNQRAVLGYARSDWYKSVDLRLRKNFLNLNGNRVGVTGSVFNVFDTQNLGCFDETLLNATGTPGVTQPNPNFGHASCTISDPRRFQLGLQYDF
jgi:hypothetical protein